MADSAKIRSSFPAPGNWIPVVAGVALGVALLFWLLRGVDPTLSIRRPGTDQPPGSEGTAGANPVLSGKVVLGTGQPANLPGDWPGFRGAEGSGVATQARGLARVWPASGPKALWSVDVGEGYAGAAVRAGRVYVMDYDQTKKQDALRCLSLADGLEIWRFAYPVPVKRNHGMSRTVPTVTDRFVVAMGPKCHVVCLDASSGNLKWSLDLVRQFGATIPPWYAGQCPLVAGESVILGVGGKDTLFVAVALATGDIQWQTPNPQGWKMTHSSLVPITVAGQRQYVYCASLGVAAVADSGKPLWSSPDWKISIATVPSPIPFEGGRLFLSGGYDAGSLMLEVTANAGTFAPRTLYRLEPTVFGATQQTPILYQGHIYGVRPDGRFACLDPAGKIVWLSEPNQQFGLGSYLIADGLIYALNDTGRLSLIEASPARFTLLAQAQVLNGRESWGPLALAGTRLLARDLTRFVCLEVGAGASHD
jgi:outer membrane protein assembly factor BamB